MSNGEAKVRLHRFSDPMHGGYISIEKMQVRCEEDLSIRASDFVFDLAQAPFAEFRHTMSLLGWDDTSMSSLFSSRIANAAASIRYPFILSWVPFRSDGSSWRADNPSFSSTLLCCMPAGWRAAFGLEFSEDIRTLLESSADPDTAFDSYRVEQIKEKYGSLRWYDGGVASDIFENMNDLNNSYEALSSRTCCDCGSFQDVRVDRGYIIPICESCRIDGNHDLFDDAVRYAQSTGFKKNFIPWKLTKQIKRVLIAQSTSPCIDKVSDGCNMNVYSGEKQTSYNAFERLRQSVVDELQVFALAARADACFPTPLPSEDKLCKMIQDPQV